MEGLPDFRQIARLVEFIRRFLRHILLLELAASPNLFLQRPPAGPSIQGAVQGQLGLKLEEARSCLTPKLKERQRVVVQFELAFRSGIRVPPRMPIAAPKFTPPLRIQTALCQKTRLRPFRLLIWLPFCFPSRILENGLGVPSEGTVAPCSGTSQESQVERCENQDDSNIHCQPRCDFPRSA